MREIITLQLGQASNYLATHFWNTQVRTPDNHRPLSLRGKSSLSPIRALHLTIASAAKPPPST